MKRFFGLVVLLIVCNSLPAYVSAQESFTNSYKGSIGKYPVMLHILKMGKDFSGYYYYQNTERLIEITGTIDTVSNTDVVTLKAYAQNTDLEAEQLAVQISRSNIRGRWKKNEQATALTLTADSFNPSGVNFDIIRSNIEARLRPKLNGSPGFASITTTIWPTGNTARAIFLRKFIAKQLFKKENISNPKAAMDEAAKKSLAEYKAAHKDEPDSVLLDFPSGYGEDYQETFMLCYQSEKFIGFSYFNYAFTGGAHGNYATSYYSVDLNGNRELTLANVFVKGSKNALSKLLAKNYLKAKGLPLDTKLSEADLFEDTVALTSNFLVTGKGILFNYPPYAISAYAVGEINIFIPYSELTPYLNPAFKKLI